MSTSSTAKDSFDEIRIHANAFADHLLSHSNVIHGVLRRYQSKDVVDDEIQRSVEMLRNIDELQSYFISKVNKVSAFLPLNLPLYSFVLFAAVPSYQSLELVVRAPERMGMIFDELCHALSLDDFYKNIIFFSGKRQDFVDIHCVSSDVVIFTGKYENFIKIREMCGKKTLMLFNGVGHNPIVVTETADVNVAVEKTLHVKLFNNGQDCAGPDMILVHSTVIDQFLSLLTQKLKSVKTDYNYNDALTKIGPLFEPSSLSHFSDVVKRVSETGGEIIEGGVVDYKKNIIHPCVCRHTLQQYTNYDELYSPIFIVTEYINDTELDLYFNDPNSRYIQKQMYVSIFGYSKYIAENLPGTIPLVNISVHDSERGTEEYGGYSVGASAVSFNKLMIPKPILVPREIYTYMLSPYNKLIKESGSAENIIIEMLFKDTVQKIFKDNLVFAYIFGSYARNRAKSYSDVDTMVCVKKKDSLQIHQYLEWLFGISEIFGKIPDFKYPAEIVEFNQLQKAATSFENLSLVSEINSADAYDSMLWLHSLSHYKVAVVYEENIPSGWENIFPSQSSRILKEFLSDLRGKMLSGMAPKNYDHFSNIPTSKEGIDNYIKNLGNGRKLIDILRYISFEEKPLYSKDVIEFITQRNFFGRKVFIKNKTKFNFDSSFRFGVTG